MRAVAFALALAACASHALAQYSYDTYWFEQDLDHFDFGASGKTFKQRYLVNTDHWDRASGPIFFYTGNEGPIDLFANNTGFMWDLAPEFGAALVFAEHRYYGQTMPVPNPFKDPKSGSLDWLTSEQALADYAVLLTALKKQWGTDAPIVAFGGSYGGMLTAWFRLKYPNVVVGGIAASAPILQFTGVTGPDAYSHVMSSTWEAASTTCANTIASSWKAMQGYAQSQSGRDLIASKLRVCEPLDTVESVTSGVFNWISAALQYMTMADYPYPASFLGPMPAWPVKVACSLFKEDNPPFESLLDSLHGVMNIYLNYTGEAGQCFHVNGGGPSTLKDLGGWNYQACTEMIMPIGQYGLPNDILFDAPWNLTDTVDSCKDTYAQNPRPQWVNIHYGAREALKYASNIVFSNGNLDPWSSGGVLKNVTGNSNIVAITVDQGAHHLDLRSSNPADPQSVIMVRNVHRMHIRNWIAAYNEQRAQ